MKELLDQDAKQLLEEGLEEIGRAGETLEVTFLQKNADNDQKYWLNSIRISGRKKLGVKSTSRQHLTTPPSTTRYPKVCTRYVRQDGVPTTMTR